jgi:porphobilinogen deaminase
MVADVQTGEMVRASEDGSPDSPVELGQKLAEKVKSMGADKIIERAERS